MIYNENDPFAAQWLRNLIAAGHLPEGAVDARSIEEIKPGECAETMHFFAGIGGWPYALRLAGWPDADDVWTGSCPCQGLSVAGRGEGAEDERHLWLAWFPLIRECRPPTIFGEQVASSAGRDWLAAVQSDLETLGYRFGAADLSAAGSGAPHIRQRFYWVAYSQDADRRGRECRAKEGTRPDEVGRGRPSGGCADRMAGTERGPAKRHRHEMGGEASGLQGEARGQRIRADAGDGIRLGQLADSDRQRQQERPKQDGEAEAGVEPPRRDDPGRRGFWSDADWLPCRDGKARPVEPGTFPLAHGIPGRVGRLRGYGNAIVPQLAAEFIRAAMESIEETKP